MHRCLILLLLPLLGAFPPPAKQIAIVNVSLAQYDGGPSIPSDFKFTPGETVDLSFQVSGYQVYEKDHVLVYYKLQVADPQNVPLIQPRENKVMAELAPEDKDWLPKVRESFVIPSTAGSGTYKITAWAKDNTSGVEVIKEIPFAVRAHDIERIDALTIQNFHFYRGENEPVPLREEPSYKAGDPVWAKFDITGFKYAANNKYAVKYGLAVLDAENKELYAVPEAAADTDESFYPKRYVPGMLTFTLPPDIKTGLYAVALHAEDQGGGQKTQIVRKFRVE